MFLWWDRSTNLCVIAIPLTIRSEDSLPVSFRKKQGSVHITFCWKFWLLTRVYLHIYYRANRTTDELSWDLLSSQAENACFIQLSDWTDNCLIDTCLGFHQLSVHLGKAFKEGFIQEELALGGVTGWEEAENSCSVLLVHGQDDAHGHLSNSRRTVLQSSRAELREDREDGWLLIWWASILYSWEKPSYKAFTETVKKGKILWRY